jgi:hypothetical protein
MQTGEGCSFLSNRRARKWLFQWIIAKFLDAVDGYLTARRNGNAAACELFLDDMKKARFAAHEAALEEIWLLPPKLGRNDQLFAWYEKMMRHLLYEAPNPGPRPSR